MGNKNRNRNNASKQNQGASMSQSHESKQAELDAAFQAKDDGINPEAKSFKDQATEKAGETFTLIKSIPKTIYDKGIMPAYNFSKGLVTRAWTAVCDAYASELAAFKEMGATSYLLARGSKIALKALKIVGAFTAAMFLNSYVLGKFGISLYSPMTLMVIAIVAVLAVVAKSIMDQRSVGSVSAKVVGENILDALAAA